MIGHKRAYLICVFSVLTVLVCCVFSQCLIKYSKATTEYLNEQKMQRKEERNVGLQRVVRREFRRVFAASPLATNS